MKIILLIGLMLCSGVAGRLGGSAKDGSWYDFLKNTNTRDIGCSLLLLITVISYFVYNSVYLWAYVLTGILTFGSFRTYWDRLFGYDCMWFSGLVVGLAAIPMIFVDPIFFWIVPIRAVFLACWWELLNKKLPQEGIRIWRWTWRRDVAEEFLRYSVTL